MEVETVQTRKTLIDRLAPPTTWDLLVIGGGATGLGIALEAVSRGYSVLLVEQADFAKGTSSRSTKLVHGGVRYLAQGDIQLVREASIERGLLWRNAPHLVKNQTFIIPIYTFWDRLKYTIGLKLYDWISGRLSLGSSVFVPRSKALQKLPNIRSEGLVGGVLYHDGQFDDSRLAINLVQTIIEQGGVALNYMKVTGLLKDNGQIAGATITDVETNRSYVCKAKAVINATGVFVDEVLQMDNPTGTKSITASQGVHLVLDKKFYPSNDALMIPATSDGRVLFAVPWHGKVVVGTTDTPVTEASLEPQALEKEIAFILENASRYFVQQPKRSDVLSVFAGLRPLAAPQGGNQKTKEISRSHKIMVTPSKLFTILGGKWTTFRKMGEDMVDRIEKELRWPHKKTATRNLAIHGSVANVNLNDPLYFYGSDKERVKALMNGHSNEWLSTSLQIHEAQVVWAVQHEMARTVEDVLSRRTRALLLDARESIRMAEPVAAIMAKALQKDNNWIKEQVASYTKLAEGYVLKS
ncbi:glycerol-3-phosphate dehydrogenase/oxidase [Longitalea luteola]|uniref:glycerol-3-phosphate dehydrogenase/oxidase n=1 Tax=Longitalea luteola TaxID=2812563 RepID=UPI001A974804|nr:glycerol-3-phosphate dehydrogenase/oxidase [Longitalea luteola]